MGSDNVQAVRLMLEFFICSYVWWETAVKIYVDSFLEGVKSALYYVAWLLFILGSFHSVNILSFFVFLQCLFTTSPTERISIRRTWAPWCLAQVPCCSTQEWSYTVSGETVLTSACRSLPPGILKSKEKNSAVSVYLKPFFFFPEE